MKRRSFARSDNCGDHLNRYAPLFLPSFQKCPSLSSLDGSAEAHWKSLGDRERWNTDVLLRLLTELLTEVRHVAVKTCPESIRRDPEEEGGEKGEGEEGSGGDAVSKPAGNSIEYEETFFTDVLLKRYGR